MGSDHRIWDRTLNRLALRHRQAEGNRGSIATPTHREPAEPAMIASCVWVGSGQPLCLHCRFVPHTVLQHVSMRTECVGTTGVSASSVPPRASAPHHDGQELAGGARVWHAEREAKRISVGR
jgi:hypothetical protein